MDSETATLLGRKRSRSPTPEVKPILDSTPPRVDIALQIPKLVMIHSDAILDGRKAVTYTFQQVFSIMKPDCKPPSEAAILSALTESPRLESVYQALGCGHLTSLDQISWFTRHRNIFMNEARGMLEIYRDVKPFLQELKRQNIATIVLTSHKPEAEEVLEKHGMKGLVGMILDDADKLIKLPTYFRMIFKAEIAPWFNEHYAGRVDNQNPADLTRSDVQATAPPLDLEYVLLVSCALYNLDAAKQAGARTCWVRKCDVKWPVATVDTVVDCLDDMRLKIIGSEDKIKVEREEKGDQYA